jgi:patatin-related protein
MREKELRLALVCYGGISLAVYMHGITKEIWRLARASRAFHAGEPPDPGSDSVYHHLLRDIAHHHALRVRVVTDIIAGASAGGINGVFLAQAIATGQSLDPLADLWLNEADVDRLIDPDARPLGRLTKFWAAPIAWVAARRPGGAVEQTVEAGAREEVRAKLSRFVRARWFEPPFGGPIFTGMLLDAFDAMAAAPAGPPLLPPGQPLDLFVTVTDFRGHMEALRLNSPREVEENEHRLTIAFRHAPARGQELGSAASLAFAARSTASFPGAFPPFTADEMDAVVNAREQSWADREPFLARLSPESEGDVRELVLIDGSVLANAPFRPAIAALRDRPARREVDRRFVYVDPKPGVRAVSLGRKGKAAIPGFFSTILGAMSDIPREQPIRDNLDAIEGRSARIRRMQRIVDALRPEVEASIQTLFGRTFFLDRPTAARLKTWRAKAAERAAADAGFAYPAYGHVKLSGVVEELADLASRIAPDSGSGKDADAFRQALWIEIRARGADRIVFAAKRTAGEASIAFFRAQDLGFRIRRLRFVARTLTALMDSGAAIEAELLPVRNAVYETLAPFLDRENAGFYDLPAGVAPADFLDTVEARRDLVTLDEATDVAMAGALAACPKAIRRVALLSYVGFPYFDIATLPLLQGEGLAEFDPIKVDRIAPDDARSIRTGGAAATLKGIQLNSFGAFFSRAYRENDYLWGRLHGAERLVDIVVSTVPGGEAWNAELVRTAKLALFEAILAEEAPRLKTIASLFDSLRQEIAAGPLANPPPTA